jgi:hypothetical protein
MTREKAAMIPNHTSLREAVLSTVCNRALGSIYRTLPTRHRTSRHRSRVYPARSIPQRLGAGRDQCPNWCARECLNEVRPAPFTPRLARASPTPIVPIKFITTFVSFSGVGLLAISTGASFNGHALPWGRAPKAMAGGRAAGVCANRD